MIQNQAQSLVGQQVGPYKIDSLLGVGGMGEVYLAQDPRLDRAIALKILPKELASDPARIWRFIREAKAASGLKHPNVATIYEIGASDDFNFIAMEYIEGKLWPLESVVVRWMLPTSRTSALRLPMPSMKRTARASRTATSNRPISC